MRNPPSGEGSALAPLKRVPAKHQKEARGYAMMQAGDPDEVWREAIY
jgi:hypothetical protein